MTGPVLKHQQHAVQCRDVSESTCFLRFATGNDGAAVGGGAGRRRAGRNDETCITKPRSISPILLNVRCVLCHTQALTALLSGEMRDTAELGAMTKHAAENYLPQPSRAHMFRSWGSVIGMLPSGGNRVWGDLSGAPDDTKFTKFKKAQRLPRVFSQF